MAEERRKRRERERGAIVVDEEEVRGVRRGCRGVVGEKKEFLE